MQVKKFEARTMKDALEMVKSQMGPEAIILSVKDNQKSFGLVGDRSIEITAAVSDETLHKKNFVESKMRNQDRAKFAQVSARQQIDVIDKVIKKHLQKDEVRGHARRYVDIEDDYTPEMAAEVRHKSEPIENQDLSKLRSEIADLKELLNRKAATHAGAQFGIAAHLNSTFEKLVQTGIRPEYAAELVLLVQKNLSSSQQYRKAAVEACLGRMFLSEIKTDQCNKQIHLFVGPTGSGKTSTLIKYAGHLVVREKKRVALLSCDTEKVGASEQMKIFSQILNVPFALIKKRSDWLRVMGLLKSYDKILVDMPGKNLRTSVDTGALLNIMPPREIQEIATHLVLSVWAKDTELREMVKRYKQVHFTDLVFTGIDECSQPGLIYQIHKEVAKPLFGFGIGPRIPEDFEYATSERVIDLILQITQPQAEENL